MVTILSASHGALKFKKGLCTHPHLCWKGSFAHEGATINATALWSRIAHDATESAALPADARMLEFPVILS